MSDTYIKEDKVIEIPSGIPAIKCKVRFIVDCEARDFIVDKIQIVFLKVELNPHPHHISILESRELTEEQQSNLRSLIIEEYVKLPDTEENCLAAFDFLLNNYSH